MGRLWDWIKDRASDAIEWVKDKIFGGPSYSGGSVDRSAQIHSNFVKFSEEISKKARELEDSSLEFVKGAFEKLLHEYESCYPSTVQVIRDGQKKAAQQLKGTIVSYVEKNATESNDEIKAILAMDNEKERKAKGKRKMEEILEEAESLFRQKLKEETNQLQNELQDRLKNYLNSKQAALREQEKDLKKIEKELENDTGCLERLELESKIIFDSDRCISNLLENERI